MAFAKDLEEIVKMITTHAEMPLGFMSADLGRLGSRRGVIARHEVPKQSQAQ